MTGNRSDIEKKVPHNFTSVSIVGHVENILRALRPPNPATGRDIAIDMCVNGGFQTTTVAPECGEEGSQISLLPDWR